MIDRVKMISSVTKATYVSWIWTDALHRHWGLSYLHGCYLAPDEPVVIYYCDSQQTT